MHERLYEKNLRRGSQFMGLVPETLLTLALSAIFNYNERVRWRLNQLLGDELAQLRQVRVSWLI